MHKHPAQIVLSPRITEKGAFVSSLGVYVFHVAKDANKQQIADAVRTLYKVTPVKVRVVHTERKSVMTRGTNRKGTTRGAKKAYVYLKKGDTIELV